MVLTHPLTTANTNRATPSSESLVTVQDTDNPPTLVNPPPPSLPPTLSKCPLQPPKP